MHLLLAQKVLLSEKGLRRKYPPQCDQFLGHRSLYLPTAALKLLEIEHKTRCAAAERNDYHFPVCIYPGFQYGSKDYRRDIVCQQALGKISPEEPNSSLSPDQLQWMCNFRLGVFAEGV